MKNDGGLGLSIAFGDLSIRSSAIGQTPGAFGPYTVNETEAGRIRYFGNPPTGATPRSVRNAHTDAQMQVT